MLGDKIRQHRKRNHLSQEELAEKLGVSRQSISLWENNQTQPTIENIVVLAKLFDISTDELLTTSSETADCYAEPFYVPTPPATDPIPQPVITPTNPTYPTEDSTQAEAQKEKKNHKKAIIIGSIILAVLLVAGIFVAWVFSKGNIFGEAPVLSAEEIYTKISPSVVEISAESATEISTGTGFFFDDKGTVITNYHVIENCQTAEITLANGSTYQVDAVLGYDANRDIAILSTTCKTSKPLSIRSASVKTGEKVYALGSSLGLTGSLSDGIVSAVNREVEGNVYIQTTAPISQGNSGGPLVDEKGAVVGIVCASFADGQNLNLAIPIAEAHKISLDNSITLEKLFPEPVQEVEWISDWRFSYYADEDTYVLLFQLAGKEEKPMSASGTVEIRIVNADNVTVYNKTHKFTFADFEEWIYDDTDEMYLATIYISPSSIDRGSTANGTVYFEVYGNGYAFDECTEDVDCLPTGTNTTPNNTQQGGTIPSNPQQGGTAPSNPQQGDSTPPTTQPTQYTCLKLTCKNVVSQNGEYCAEHKCANSSCSFEKDYNSNYCGSCTCNTVGCKNPHITNGYHCTEHTCTASGCTTEKSYGKNYCFSHTCASCDDIRVDGGFYCVNHTCSVSGCTSIKGLSSDYCTSHQCMAGTCKKQRINGGSYCEEHTCIVEGCTNQKLTSDYCYSHTP